MRRSDLAIERLADRLYLSRIQLHRELEAITSMTTTELHCTCPRRRAALFPAAGFGDVAFAAGFEN